MRRVIIALFILLLTASAQAGRISVAVLLGTPGGAGPSYPTISSAVIPTGGDTITLTASEALTAGGGGTGTWDIDCSVTGDNVTMTYASGSGTDTLVFNLGSIVQSGETCNVDFVQPGNGWEDSGGDDLQSITNDSVTNNSTQSGTTCTTGYFGNNTAESSSVNSTAGDIYCSRVTLGCGTTVDELGAYSQYVNESSKEGRLLLYADFDNSLCTGSGAPIACCTGAGTGTCDDGGYDPGSLIGNYGACADGEPTECYETTTNPGPEWVVDSTVGEVISGTPAYIWACIQVESSLVRVYYNATGGVSRKYTTTFDSPPDPWPVGSDVESTVNYAIRVHAQ